MKKVRVAEVQVLAILREAETTPVVDVARKHRIREQTIYSWRGHFAGLQPTDIRRLRTIEGENAKLKKLLAESGLEIDTFEEINRQKR